MHPWPLNRIRMVEITPNRPSDRKQIFV
uniref:Uncharacterized protein n=1 Tax=Anguilla anguilla TaxID=7936 RepID=A0A0E9TSX6_ANGAN